MAKNNITKTDEGQAIIKGFDFAVLDECIRVLKKINIYVWCSKLQLGSLINYFAEKKCSVDILVWCKTNPTPLCSNTYLSDIEYLVFAREKGVELYGEYETKHKFWVTKCNVEDKGKWGHPTIKPLHIIRQLIINSSKEGDIVLDPFMGSGTTAVAAINEKRNYLGFEINEKYFTKCCERIKDATMVQTLF